MTHIISKLFPFMFRACPRPEPGTLLLVRLDGIGDYILFRNFIKALKLSNRFKGHHITLLGSPAWKDLAERLDYDDIDVFIWLTPDKFMRSPAYRYKKLKQIRSVCYETVISPVFSRDFECTDTLVKFVCARRKIGSAGDLSNTNIRQKRKGDRYYTTLIPGDGGVRFEFSRNREFFETLLEEKLELPGPEIILKQPVSLPVAGDYAVLFIGAGEKKRQWPMAHFSKAALFIHETLGLNIVLCGGPGDRENADKFSQLFPRPYTDLVGKTGLRELPGIIKNGKLMVSNETAGPHLAVALGMPHIFVISNGNYLGRFSPYPKTMCKGYHLICHPEIRRYGYPSWLKIDDISPENLIEKLERHLVQVTKNDDINGRML